MRFSTQQHPFSCGLALHARTLYVGMLHQEGERVVQRPRPTSPDALRKTLAPSRAQRVLAVACIVTWDWLADWCAREDMPFGLGQALSRQAIHGGKAKHDPSDAPTMAVRRRGGMLPPASVDPAERRATRARLRQRLPHTRHRAELVTHVQHTHGQDTWPEMGQKRASKAKRAGVAERLPAPAVPQSLAVARALLDDEDQRRRALEWTMVQTAKPQDATPRYGLQTVPGLGKLRRLVRLSAMHARARVPRVPDGVSAGRVGKGAQASAGQHEGPAGTTSGQADLTGACSAAAGQTSLARCEQKHGQGQA